MLFRSTALPADLIPLSPILSNNPLLVSAWAATCCTTVVGFVSGKSFALVFSSIFSSKVFCSSLMRSTSDSCSCWLSLGSDLNVFKISIKPCFQLLSNAIGDWVAGSCIDLITSCSSCLAVSLTYCSLLYKALGSCIDLITSGSFLPSIEASRCFIMPSNFSISSAIRFPVSVCSTCSSDKFN